ncbi:MAG TPA: VWA domain-containing protein [Blastocatellia bacterium]|nr:VWA domain-containing protein [Blastocatellia bacterium]
MIMQRPFFKTSLPGLSRRLLICLFVLTAASLQMTPAQSQGDKEAQKKQDETVKLETRLVTLDVIVKDKKGKHVTDLKAEDFSVFEDGVAQKVEFFSPPLDGGDDASQPKSVAPAPSGVSNGEPTNIISLVLDGATTDPVNFKQVREATLKYLQERITGADTVGMFSIANDLQLLQPFTRDKAKLIAAVEKGAALPISNKNLERGQLADEIADARDKLDRLGGADAPAQGSRGAEAMIANRALQQFTLLRSQLSLQQARPVLAALAAICSSQRGVTGKKTIVLFSQGFILPATLDWQAQSVIDFANQANVAIYIIDSAGLRTSSPLSTSPVPSAPLAGVSGMVDAESRIRAVGGDNVFDNVRHEGQNREYDILYRISGDTGGEFIKGANDLSKGLNRIDQEIRSRYTLAFYNAGGNFDGGYRKLKVEVRRPDMHVTSRAGYYANPPGEVAFFSPEDKKLLANVASAEANPALPLFVELCPFRFKGESYVVPLSIEVPPDAVKFDRKGDKQVVQFDVVGVIREAPGKIVARLGGGFNIPLTAEQYESIHQNNIFFRQDMELLPGAYNVEIVFRDKLSGKIAAKRRELVLTALNSEFSMSGVTLSRFAEPIKKSPEPAVTTDVFSQSGVRIRPTPSREFRPTDNLIVLFELYNAAAKAETGKPMVWVTLRLMKDGQAATAPMDYVLTETVATPSPHLTFAKYVKLAGLQAGKYVAIIEARDRTAQKLLTREESFVISQ